MISVVSAYLLHLDTYTLINNNFLIIHYKIIKIKKKPVGKANKKWKLYQKKERHKDLYF